MRAELLVGVDARCRPDQVILRAAESLPGCWSRPHAELRAVRVDACDGRTGRLVPLAAVVLADSATTGGANRRCQPFFGAGKKRICRWPPRSRSNAKWATGA